MEQNYTNLSKQEYITEYLRRAADLEFERFTLEKLNQKLYNAYSECLSALEQGGYDLKYWEKKRRELSGQITFKQFLFKIFMVFYGGLYGIVPGAFIMFILLVIRYYTSPRFLAPLFDFAFSASRPKLTFFVFIPYCVAAVITLIIIILKVPVDRIKNMKELREVRRKIKTTTEMINREKARRPYLEKELGRCTVQLTNLNISRNKFYSGNLIPVKYRNAVPMSMMYEYFVTRICSELEGKDGAFARFENEIYIKRIADTVERISEKLDVVIQNQGQILRKVEDIDRKTDRIVSEIGQVKSGIGKLHSDLGKIQQSVDNIEGNAELTKYYSEVTARYAQHEMWVNGYSDKPEP